MGQKKIRTVENIKNDAKIGKDVQNISTTYINSTKIAKKNKA